MPRKASLELIEKLISFDTTSRNSNMELIAFVQDYLDGFGIKSELAKSEDGHKANLYLGGRHLELRPDDIGGIALSGHTDVVPIDGQNWSSDPWSVIEKDGKLFGRGTCDMKSFIAIVLAHVPQMLEVGPKTPIHLCFSYDEEIGCVGVRRLLSMLDPLPVKPKLCIIGEPTSMQVINAHKGKLSKICEVRGFEAHSSLAPHAVNAIEYAAKLINKVNEIAARLQSQGPFDEGFDVPHTTAHTGTVQGGTALNIVPKDCRFEFEFRNLPQDDSEVLFQEIVDYAKTELEPAMQAIQPDTGIDFSDLSSFPPLDTPPDAEVVTLAKRFAGQNDTSKVAFGTEAGLFQKHGISAVVCGPGSIEQAHKPDEFCALEQIEKCEAFMDRLIEHVAQG